MQVLTPTPPFTLERVEIWRLNYIKMTQSLFWREGGGVFWQCSVISFAKADCDLRLEQQILSALNKRLCQFDVRESVHRDTTKKITNKMHYID
jgi:hypothetical protein